MAITVAQIYTDVQNEFPDIPQATFLNLLNQSDAELQAQMRLLPQTLQQIVLTAGTGTYTLPAGTATVWAVGYSQGPAGTGLTGINAFVLTPTTFDYLDYQWPGWRFQSAGIPSFWYQDGGTIGLYPVPNMSTAPATTSGFPILNVYSTVQGAAYTIGSSLPSVVPYEWAWVYGVCVRWAMMFHPERVEGYQSLLSLEKANLRRYIASINVRRKPVVRNRIPRVRIF